MDEHGEALRPGDRNVEAVPVEQEVDAARNILAGGTGHRIENDRRLLTLKSVDGPDTDPIRHLVTNAVNGELIRGDDKDVRGCERLSRAGLVSHDAAA